MRAQDRSAALNPGRIDGTSVRVRGDGREAREQREIEISSLGRARALLAALALHVAAPGVMLLFPAEPRPGAAPASSQGEPASEIAIEVSPPAVAVDPPAAAEHATGAVARGEHDGRVAVRAAGAAADARAAVDATAPAVVTADPAAIAAGPPIVTSLPSPAAIGLALDGQNPFVTSAAHGEAPSGPPAPTATPGERPRTAAEAKRATQAVLRGTGQARDRELGLGPEGPVLHALGDATMASFAPVKGRAVFRAIADGTGMIVGIEVLSCDGGRDGWVNAAELAREALKGKKLRMPSTATHAEMRIEIVSEMKMPSGHDPGVDVSILGVPITKGEGKQATQVRILDPLSLSFLAGSADPVDIGVKARRVVHTRVLDTEML